MTKICDTRFVLESSFTSNLILNLPGYLTWWGSLCLAAIRIRQQKEPGYERTRQFQAYCRDVT